MYNRAPPDYKCPICIAIEGVEDKNTLIRQSDMVYRDELVVGFISSFFIGENLGHVIISPKRHFENIYDLEQEYGDRIQAVARKISIAIRRAYAARGTTILQNNEPVGNQHAFHYHLHIFPRYEDDKLFKNMLDKKNTTPEERKPYAEKIKSSLRTR